MIYLFFIQIPLIQINHFIEPKLAEDLFYQRSTHQTLTDLIFPCQLIVFKEMENQQKQTRTFKLQKGIQFSSDFQCGNLASVRQKDNTTYELYIKPDPKTSFRTWFYFSIKGVSQGTIITFRIMNMNNQVKLFRQGHLPVYKSEKDQLWSRIRIPLQQNGIVKGQEGFQLTFKHCFSNKYKHYFAFSFPWSNSENNLFIQSLIQMKKVGYFCEYKPLCQSTKGLHLNLLTLTKQLATQKLENEIQKEDETVKLFPNKKGIFISSRVHPGEVASSFILNGLLRFLFSNNKQAQKLLQNFVFYIVPILNPDGVSDGNFRTDSNGKNLNRHYTNPSKQQQPQIYGVKQFLIRMIKNNQISFCLDLHAHVNKQGAFIYGNSTSSLKDQVSVCLFPKLLEYNSRFFDYQSCNFSQSNMISKDKGDQLSKQGASRVAIYKETGLATCWTLECNYNSCKFINILSKQSEENGSSKSVSHNILLNASGPIKKEQNYLLNINDFQEIGQNIAVTILDFYNLRQKSRYTNSTLKSLSNINLHLAIQSLRMVPFKFDQECRKFQISIASRQNLNETFARILEKINLKNPNYFISNKLIRQRPNSRSKDKNTTKKKIQSAKSITQKSFSQNCPNFNSIKDKKDKFLEKIVVLMPNIPRATKKI